MENQIQQPEVNKASNRKTIALIVGGGCALIACIALVVVAALALLGPTIGKTFSSISANPSLVPQNPVPSVMAPSANYPQADDNKLGDPNAPVQMTLYSDFQCPYCKDFWQETQPQIIDNYVKTGKVLFIYRSAGNWVSQIGGGTDHESENAAMAAYCAGDQNKFWDYHDVLFTNVAGEDVGSFSDSNLQAFAQSLGLDMNQFNSCYTSRKYASRVNQDYQDAISAGIQGTPFFVISYNAYGQTKTVTIDGAQPFSAFQQAINSALNGQ